jgi:hypothetical protein
LVSRREGPARARAEGGICMTYRRAGRVSHVSPASTPVEASSKRALLHLGAVCLGRPVRLMAPRRDWPALIGTCATTPAPRCKKATRTLLTPPSAHSQCPMLPDQHPNHSSRGKIGFSFSAAPCPPPEAQAQPGPRHPSTVHRTPTARGMHMHSWLGELFGACLWPAASRSGCGT